ncbi:MAG: hypothetical protein CMM58_08475 [Rhodospirillaceae bacterium]|nr:hypothetical protein [Rhodospirillaceae bacterium]|tara:strand:- start:253 stop:735 length:483 start_codon:yes stop_codon:yes gene_type:complete
MKTFANILIVSVGMFFLTDSIAMPKVSKPQAAKEQIKMETIKIIHMDPTQLDNIELSPENGYSFMEIIAGNNPEAGTLNSYKSVDGKFNAGLSEYSKMTLRLKDWPQDEFMYFLEGQVEITNEDGSSKVYGPGDAIVMPKGFSGTWRQLSTIKKIHVSYP